MDRPRVARGILGWACGPLRSLLADLATLTRNTVRFGRATPFPVLATPTELQRRALDLLGIKPVP